MQLVTLPNTKISVSQLAFGCWGIASDFHWGERDDSESVGAIHAALDAGVNFFDTAAVYGEGSSEILLGKTLAARRKDVVIASKVLPTHMKPDHLIACCEASLSRLNTDYLDLYQTHWTHPDVPPEESWGAMQRLKEQGKVRAIGVCNLGPADLGAIADNPPTVDQLPYNLLWRMIESEIVPLCQKSNIGILAYSPLMHGLLADKYETAADVPDGRARSRHFSTDRELARHGEPGCEKETFAAIAAIREIANRLNRSMADVSLAWTAAQPGITSVIAGARNAAQMGKNAESFENPLPSEEIDALNQATLPLRKTLGNNLDMWQGAEKSRYR